MQNCQYSIQSTKKENMMKRLVAVLFLILVVGLVVGCGSSGGTSILGTYVYQSAPAGQGPVVEFQKGGVFKATIPPQTQTAQNPQQPQSTKPQVVTGAYETSIDLVKIWKDKKSMAGQPPASFFLIYKGTLIDGGGNVLVKKGTTSSSATTSSATP
jgi:hypothetical protein